MLLRDVDVWIARKSRQAKAETDNRGWVAGSSGICCCVDVVGAGSRDRHGIMSGSSSSWRFPLNTHLHLRRSSHSVPESLVGNGGGGHELRPTSALVTFTRYSTVTVLFTLRAGVILLIIRLHTWLGLARHVAFSVRYHTSSPTDIERHSLCGGVEQAFASLQGYGRRKWL